MQFLNHFLLCVWNAEKHIQLKERNFREEIYKGSSFCIFYLFIKRSFRRVIYQTLFLLDIVFILEYAFRLQSKKPISEKVGEYTSGYLPVFVVQPSLELL